MPIYVSGVLLKCAITAQERGLPIEFVVIGYTNIDDRLRKQNVKFRGRYEEALVWQILAEQHVDIVFLPSVWPETFCYTLSIAIAAELPTCVFEIDAQAKRLREIGRSLVLPLTAKADRNTIKDRLIDFVSGLRKSSESVLSRAAGN